MIRLDLSQDAAIPARIATAMRMITRRVARVIGLPDAFKILVSNPYNKANEGRQESEPPGTRLPGGSAAR